MLIIIARRREGIRRCGVFHPGEHVEHADAAFTTAQVKILKADPDLIVTEKKGEPPK